ncbi:hypothetical protein Tco_0031085 [Tanacetum coccineum]
MMINPTQVYDQKTKTTLGAQNPFYLKQAKKAQPALYDGDERLKPHHVLVIVPSSEEELELAEATRNKLHMKMNDSVCVEKRVNITPPNYLKENFMATFTPQTQLTPEQVFWSLDLAKRKAEELKANAPPLPVPPPATVAMKAVFENLEAEVDQNEIDLLSEKNNDSDPTLDLKALVSQNKDLTAKLNALHNLNERFRAENAKVKQHYKELYDSIKITRAKTTDQNNSLLSEIENLKAQLKDNSKCVTILDSKPKVLAPGRYPIDVEPIPPRLKKNREVYLHYIKHLKENVETLRKIIEEAKVKRPLDTSRASACRVKGASASSMSKPRSNTKKDRTLPAKSALKQVEAHSRMNKLNEKQKNHVDSSISYKRTIINSNPNTSCKTCNKCLISVNHDQCVVRSEVFVKQSSATKWRPTGRLLPLGDQWPLTRNTPPKVLPTKQWKPTGRLLPLGRQCPLVRSTALKSDCMPADPQETIAPVAYNLACTN